MKSVISFIMPAICCLALCGCDSDTGSSLAIDLVPCDSDQDCPEGLVCTVEGVCVTISGDDDDNISPNNTEDCQGEDCEECEVACREDEVCRNGACICKDGAERSCGIKGGECAYGLQTCTDGAWSQCIGAIDPVDEICDHRDNDCDGTIDEGVSQTYFRDTDNDNWGVDDFILACEPRNGFSEVRGDCDDTNPDIHPLADELCNQVDDNCNGEVDEAEGLVGVDIECNQLGVCEGTTPVCEVGQWVCNVLDERFEPIEDSCDTFDNDCDGAVDEGLAETYYPDTDGDTYGDMRRPTPACGPMDGLIARAGDCNDDDPDINPEGQEVCDGVDNDCDLLFDIVDDSIEPPDIACNQVGVCEGTQPTCFGAEGWQCLYPDTYQAEIEVSCDGLDNDCDGDVDEGLARSFYPDLDRDGFGNNEGAVVACRAPQGFIARGGDCDDDDRNINPFADEVCDGLDNNCNELIDDEDGALMPSDLVCIDRGVCAGTRASCHGPQGWRCDYDADLFEAQEETCDGLDNDCDGETDEGLDATFYFDGDEDGFGNPNTSVSACGPPAGFVRVPGDCNDAEALINPDAREVCDGLDNDCDEAIDADDQSLETAPIVCNQLGVCAGTNATCTGEVGWLCLYLNPSYENETETRCDDLDNDCDGETDEGLSRACGSDIGVCSVGVSVCAGGQYGACDGDVGIDPTDDESIPNLCDGLDNDCDGRTDEGCACQNGQEVACGTDIGLCTPGTQVCVDGDFGPCSGLGPVVEFCDANFLDHNCDGMDDIEAGLTTTYYTDTDSDGFGTGPVRHKCGPLGPREAPVDGDCADNDPNINPGAPELCDGVDNNCNDVIDDNPRSEPLLCNQLGVCQGTNPTCQGADGWQCVVTSPFYEPGDEATCDGLDNDCDGPSDEELTNTFYIDRDRDGFGAGNPRQRCGPLEPGQSARDDDCDDNDIDINPGAVEVCGNRQDDDCDGDVDEGCDPCDRNVDADFDGANECDDCDDTNGGVFPGATETCNGLDDDCDGLVDEDFDLDRDNYSVCAINPEDRDCDDSNPSIHPGAVEDCGLDGRGNGIDENCNGYIDEGCDPCEDVDTDNDGISECDGDCAPDDINIFPGAEERCDGLDNDCNQFTTTNCDVSEPCNWPDEADICENDLTCACIVNGGGQCQDEYICTAPCNTSETGVLGDGCAEDQICLYDMLYSANVHGCAVVIDGVQGTSRGGQTCGGDEDCRSNSCDRLCVGPGCNQRYCQDWCGSDAYCTAPDTFCRISRGSTNIDGRCWPDDGPFHDPTGAVGHNCTGDTQCDHGLCGNFSDGRYCTEGCCSDDNCQTGFTCSLRGDQIATNVYHEPSDAADCNNNNDCAAGLTCRAGKCTWDVSETTPMCQRDENGQGSRPAGAACDGNSDCNSAFCEATLGVCVDVCCNDSTCPQGLTCEFQFVQTTSALITQARVCVNLSTDSVFERR